MWYWEYIIKIWDSIDRREEERSGVVTAENMTEAMEVIESYYGDEIMNVITLKAITDVVFDFNTVNEDDSDFDFVISKKNR